MHEELGLSPEQIAEALGLDLTAVKTVLGSSSPAFRRKAAVDDTAVSATEVAEAKRAILEVMRYTEDENLRFRAARFMFDDGKGRHDKIGQTNLNINVHLVNDQLQRARKALEAARAKVIDVPSHVQALLQDSTMNA